MGFLEGARRLRRLKELPKVGQHATAALDASVWLHQLAVGVDAVAAMKGDYEAVITAFIRRLYKLLFFNVLVFVVFDGAENPAKLQEDAKRASSRAAARQRFASLCGDVEPDPHELEKLARAAFSRTPELQEQLQDRLSAEGFRWMVAPREADSQLAWLARSGRVEYIITEDSDSVILGCPNVLTVVDLCKGQTQLITHSLVVDSETQDPFCKVRLLSTVRGRGEQGLWLLASLAGCDFCKLPRISLMRALLVMKRMPEDSSELSCVPEAAEAAGVTLPEDSIDKLRAGIAGFSEATAWAVPTSGQLPETPELLVAVEQAIVQPSVDSLLQLPVQDWSRHAQLAPPAVPLSLPANVRKGCNTVRLSVDMIDGAVLPPVDTWVRGHPSKDDLVLFARTRGMTGVSAYNRDKLAQRCKIHLDMEAARGGPIDLRDPNMSNGLTLLLRQGKILVEACT